MARIKTEKTSAVADTHLLDPQNQTLVNNLLSQGWTLEQLQSEIPVKKNSPYRVRKHPFVVFHRAIQNPCFQGGGQALIGKKTPFFPKGTFQGLPQTQQNQGVSATNLTGSSLSMGETHSQVRPQGANPDGLSI